MQKSNEVQFVSEGLRAQPIIVDAADLGLVNRPRMWWLRVNWKQARKNPFTDQALRWGSLQKMPRLYMDFPWLESSDLELEGCRLHIRVEKHECRLPCMTTPAPTSEGRPPPKKKSRMRPDTRARWLEDSRQFAPWHYDEEHMLVDASGNFCLPSVTIKEQLQGLPIGYTGVCDMPARSRHRMLGNAWHCTVAKFLLTFILLFGHLEGTTSCRSIPPTPRQSALQLMLSLAWTSWNGPSGNDILWTSYATGVRHVGTFEGGNYATSPFVESTPNRMRSTTGFHQVASFGRWYSPTAWWGGGWNSTDGWELPWRNTSMVLSTASSHTTGVLADKWLYHPDPGLGSTSQGLQLPRIATSRGWLAWRLPTDRGPEPWTGLGGQTGRAIFSSYHLWRLQAAQQSVHSAEVGSEAYWPSLANIVRWHPTQPLPTSEVLAAVCFSVVQSDKVRRCEDFRRSFHNSTLQAADVPTHHSVDSYVHLCRHFGNDGVVAELWTHDLDSAYRQFPIKDRSVGYSVLFTPAGPTLWCHSALCFGASASVWAFNRCADMIQFVARKLLLVPVHHFVDDFGAAEPSNLAMSGFSSFQSLFGTIGMQMKEKKAPAPQLKQKLLGVNFIITKDQLTLQVCPDRLERLQAQIQSILLNNALQPMEEQKLAGKLVFLQTTTFGNVGRALTYPLYARAHGLGHDSEHVKLNHPLRDALLTLHHVLKDLRHRCFLRNGWPRFQTNRPRDSNTVEPFSHKLTCKWLGLCLQRRSTHLCGTWSSTARTHHQILL